jgi:hypothetical protein
MAISVDDDIAANDEAAPDDPDLAALTDIWRRLARPFEPVPTLAGIVGLPLNAVAQLVGTVLATSGEAEHLLDHFPTTIRSLATSMEISSERCYGSLRGPVLWSETNSARAATAGNPNLFVCMTPSRAYDIDENRILVYALGLVRDAGRAALESIPGRSYDDPHLREAKRNHTDAGRFLEHPSLRSVTRGRPKHRAFKRTRSSRSKKAYDPALRLIERASDPVTPADLSPYVDRRTGAQHRLLMALVHKLESHGARLPDFRVEQGALFSGPLQYYHPRGVGHTHRVSGIVLGQLLIDLPDRLHERNRARAEAALEARSGGRPSAVIMDESDIDRALRTAITLARR